MVTLRTAVNSQPVVLEMAPEELDRVLATLSRVGKESTRPHLVGEPSPITQRRGEALIQILEKEGRPLTTKELTERLIEMHGDLGVKDPSQSVRYLLIRDKQFSHNFVKKGKGWTLK